MKFQWLIILLNFLILKITLANALPRLPSEIKSQILESPSLTLQDRIAISRINHEWRTDALEAYWCPPSQALRALVQLIDEQTETEDIYSVLSWMSWSVLEVEKLTFSQRKELIAQTGGFLSEALHRSYDRLKSNGAPASSFQVLALNPFSDPDILKKIFVRARKDPKTSSNANTFASLAANPGLGFDWKQSSKRELLKFRSPNYRQKITRFFLPPPEPFQSLEEMHLAIFEESFAFRSLSDLDRILSALASNPRTSSTLLEKIAILRTGHTGSHRAGITPLGYWPIIPLIINKSTPVTALNIIGDHLLEIGYGHFEFNLPFLRFTSLRFRESESDQSESLRKSAYLQSLIAYLRNPSIPSNRIGEILNLIRKLSTADKLFLLSRSVNSESSNDRVLNLISHHEGLFTFRERSEFFDLISSSVSEHRAISPVEYLIEWYLTSGDKALIRTMLKSRGRYTSQLQWIQSAHQLSGIGQVIILLGVVLSGVAETSR